jgi:protein-S-isoprenylcysteine O-methyltransferase Ste14
VADRSSRLPDLGSRGQGWVVLQGALLLGLAASAAFARPWPDAGSVPRLTTGAAVILAGLALLLAGSRALGASLTPLPRPREGAAFRDDGIYGRARHPIYGGVLLLALGMSLFTSPVALLPMALLVVLFEGKSRREEAWLLDRYEGYAAYRERVRRRFLPGLW